MTTVLNVDNLSVAFRQSEAVMEVVRHVSFIINAGESLALVGESGSGKSVTALAIMGLLPRPMAFHPCGSIRFEDQDLLTLSDARKREIRGAQIGMIFQEPISALNPLHTVQKQISESLRIHQPLTTAQVRRKTLELLDEVRIVNPQEKLRAYPHQLSGGQRQRVMIAMALANRPKLLIADEPTTALDVTVQKEIMDLLRDIQSRHGMSLLIITHDLGVVRYMADRILVMKDGEIVENNTTAALFARPEHAYTRLLLRSRPDGSPVTLDGPIDSAPAILRADRLTVKFPLEKPLFSRAKRFFHALKNVSLTVPAGSTLGIVGESGSGKSTLALSMLRLVASEGAIVLEDRAINHLQEKQIRPLRKEMQIVFQDPFSSLSPRLSVEEIISEGLVVHHALNKTQRQQRVVDIMTEVGLDPAIRYRYPHEFSGGQRQRIAIARVLILNPKVIFLDEPTSALDYAVQAQIIDLLRKLQRQRKLTYILISHDINVIRVLSHRVAVMKQGEIVEQGRAHTVLNDPQHPYTQTLLAATLDDLVNGYCGAGCTTIGQRPMRAR